MVQFRVEDSAVGEMGQTVWPVYESIFGDSTDYSTWRATVWDKHTDREGFRLVRALDDGVLVGFAYGYTGESGQWWTDNARKVLAPDVAEGWLGGHFEVVSIGVVEGVRGRGIGRELMHLLLAGLPHNHLLLMTSADPSDPARQLYASEGWHVLGPGIGDRTVIMGRPGGTAMTM